MTNANVGTNPPVATLLLHQLEHELDAAWEHMTRILDSDEATAAASDRFDAIVHRIEKVQPVTLGDVRIWAKALNRYYCGNVDASIFDLLAVLEDLPERLWDERIGPA